MRRYTELRPSAGTQIPVAMRRRVLARDHGCVGPRIGLDGPCLGAIELDHIRASHAMGKKSETAEHNLVSLCGRHHLVRTENGRWIRPLLVAYVEEASR
jgi:5-methylcytosine-specific restriction endonuclease McrA